MMDINCGERGSTYYCIWVGSTLSSLCFDVVEVQVLCTTDWHYDFVYLFFFFFFALSLVVG